MGVKRASSLNAMSSRYSVVPTVGYATADVLVVAGGGGGGSGTQSNYEGSGGGAGGLAELTSIGISKGLQYTVTVGAGGSGVLNTSGTDGSDSLFGIPSGTVNIDFGIRTKGGGQGLGSGFGGTYYGGSGGGGSRSGGVGLAILANQGNAGGAGHSNGCGGGGGAGAAGTPFAPTGFGTGGIGKQSSITGTATYYAGGGGAASRGTSINAGGNGGGGNGGWADIYYAVTGTTGGAANTGGGGGGTFYNYAGGNGGSGVVIVRTSNTVPLATTTGSPTISYPAGYIVYKFTSSGTITFS